MLTINIAHQSFNNDKKGCQVADRDAKRGRVVHSVRILKAVYRVKQKQTSDMTSVKSSGGDFTGR